MENVFVTNEPVSSCCGAPRGKCSCGGRTANVSPPKPTPLGIPVMNFGGEHPTVQAVQPPTIGVTRNGLRPAQPLGIPVMNFEQSPTDKKAPPTSPQSVTNTRPNRGLGIPVMQW